MQLSLLRETADAGQPGDDHRPPEPSRFSGGRRQPLRTRRALTRKLNRLEKQRAAAQDAYQATHAQRWYNRMRDLATQILAMERA